MPENIRDMIIFPLQEYTPWVWKMCGEDLTWFKRVFNVPGKLSGHSDESKKNAERGWLESGMVFEWTTECMNVLIVVIPNELERKRDLRIRNWFE